MITGEPTPTAPSLVAPPIPDSKPEAPKDLDSTRFAAFAKKEADLVRRQQAFKADQDKFGAERSQVQDILKKRDLFEDTKKKDPVEALKLIGFSEQDIFNFLAAQEKKEQTPVETATEVATKIADEKIAALKKEQADKETKLIADRDAGLIKEFRSGLASVVEGNKDKYEYCAYNGPAAIDLAYRTVLQIVEDSKGEDIPTAEEAIQMIEELYEEEDKAMMSIKKRQPKTEESVVETKTTPERTRTVTTPAGHTPVAPAIQKTRTLSNAARPTAAATTRVANETREQKRERLVELIRRNGLTK